MVFQGSPAEWESLKCPKRMQCQPSAVTAAGVLEPDSDPLMHPLQKIPSNQFPESRGSARLESGNAGSGGGVHDDEALVDLTLVWDLARFVRNACRRHRGVVVAVAASFVAAGVASQLLLPKKYYTETKLLADRNVVMPLLGNPGRRMADEADTPTRLAPDLIMTRENLERIIAATDLLRETERKQSRWARLRSALQERMKGKKSAQDQMDEAVWRLRTTMNVRVADGTVIIGALWDNPDDAFRVVQAAQQLFLQERQDQEVSLITGSISILEQRSVAVRQSIDAMLDSLSRQRVALTPEEVQLFSTQTRARGATGPSAELQSAQARLDVAARVVAELELAHSRRLAELQATLAEQRNVYGTAHPLVETTEAALRTAQAESPQLAQARAEEVKQRAAVMRLGGGTIAAAPGAAATNEEAFATAALRSLATARVDSVVQERQAFGKSRLHIAMESYRALLERLDAARIELQTVRATFRYKYGVLIPASIPKTAVSPNSIMIVLGASIVGAVIAVLVAVAMDLASGKVLEAWQINRTLKLPLLGEIGAA